MEVPASKFEVLVEVRAAGALGKALGGAVREGGLRGSSVGGAGRESWLREGSVGGLCGRAVWGGCVGGLDRRAG